MSIAVIWTRHVVISLSLFFFQIRLLLWVRSIQGSIQILASCVTFRSRVFKDVLLFEYVQPPGYCLDERFIRSFFLCVPSPPAPACTAAPQTVKIGSGRIVLG